MNIKVLFIMLIGVMLSCKKKDQLPPICGIIIGSSSPNIDHQYIRVLYREKDTVNVDVKNVFNYKMGQPFCGLTY